VAGEQPSAFGTQLRRHREAAGLSQEELAERASLTAGAIGALERGERRLPYPHTVQVLATALGLDEVRRAELIASVPRRGPGGPPPGPTASTGLGMGVVARTSLTSFVGRRRELGRLRALLSETRLVTITGPGGVGKTRLAEEFSSVVARSFDTPPAFAYLAAAHSPIEVGDVVAASVGLRNRGERPVQRELVEYLADQRLLLMVDNCEHVAAAAAEIAAELLGACPGILIVATGRQPLRVPGEQLFPVAGLQLDAAVELFADRARHALPEFVLDEASRPLVETICLRLDSMPLAIELAAPRIRSIGLVDLTRRLEGHLPDLGAHSIVAPERQRTLRDAVGWSHELLTDPEKVVWRRLSVFSGGFTLEAAELVARIDPVDPAQIADLLGELVDKSMVVFDPSTERYRLLEALREFGHERLVEAGEAPAIVARHRAWLLAVVGECDDRWYGPDQVRLLDRVAIEAANLRAALEGCRAADAATEGLKLASAALWYWLTRAGLEEGSRWYAAFLGKSGDPVLEARASWRAGYLATLRHDFPAAERLLATSVRSADAANDSADRAYARNIVSLGIIYQLPTEEARRLGRETLADPAADPMCRSWALMAIALSSFLLGNFEECRRASLEGVAMSRDVGDLWCLELHLRSLAYAEWQLGRADAAERALRECLAIDRKLDDVWHLAWSTETLAWIAVDRGRLERGARLLGVAARLWEQTGSRLAGPWQVRHASAVERLRERLGEGRLSSELQAGGALSRADALAFALEAPPVHRGVGTEPELLSTREREVAALVAAGLNNRAIAEKLFLSPRTVEKHIEHVMDKLGVGSRAEIAAWYARQPRPPLASMA
jgi:predicted ATPase/DNA-binding CsgD family transcriptional regulator/transcriptional regulator with XRE-family HTH domain